MNKIKGISFWKRDPYSVENIQKLKITIDKKDVSLVLESNEKHIEKPLPYAEYVKMVDYLFDILHIDETEEQFKAFQYENNVNDFNLKFFLEVDYINSTYLAIKGIHPFKQPNYKEIMSFFTNIIESK